MSHSDSNSDRRFAWRKFIIEITRSRALSIAVTSMPYLAHECMQACLHVLRFICIPHLQEKLLLSAVTKAELTTRPL